MNSEKGYTLFELIIVIAILGAFTFIVIPSFIPVSDSHEVDHFLEQLQEDIYLTQAMALSRGKPAYLNFTASRHYYRVFLDGERMLQRDYPTSILVEKGSLETRIDFNPNGNIRKIGTMIVRTKKGRYTLTFQLGKGRFDVSK